MTERAQRIMEAFYKDEDLDGNFIPDKNIVANVLREIANCFEYDSYGLAWLNADDFNQIADELEAL